MSSLPPVHIAIMQPAGYVHSLVFLDTARYVRHQFRRMGAEVSLAKNRLREDALNIVFGAHLGFPPAWRRRHACIFFNLEQLGQGGASLSPDYLQLLRGSAVVDYDASNVAAYCSDPADVPVVPFLHAPYLAPEQSPALAERPIDLLFFGSMNPRRRAFIERVEAGGLQVAMFDHAIYGAERDAFIRQAKAVLNCHFYESSRFEQVRAFHCLSLGTPVISERNAATNPSAAFDDAVFWLQDGAVERFFGERFNTPAWFDEARGKLQRWQQHDPIEPYADLLAFGAGYLQAHGRTRGTEPWAPKEINLGSGKDYKPGWLNVDILDRAEPDVVLDLGRAIELPMSLPTRFGGSVLLEAGSVERFYANNVLEHVPDLPALMSNVLALLKEGGTFEIEVPYEKALTAWQDPTHVRAMNENSWVYYTDWFWYLGWFEHRFEVAQSSWLDMQLKPCNKEAAAFMRMTLRKIPTTLRERTVARTMRPDFGGVEDDLDVAAAPQEAHAPSLAG
jgi:SAM-dependent methyltransferase